MKAPVVLLTTNLARGGAEMQVAQLAIALRSRGWRVSVVSLLRPSAFENELASSGVAVFSVDMQPGIPNPLALARLASILRKLRPRILHSHLFHANIVARAIRSICPVPVVISTLHSIAESSRRSADVRSRDWLYRITDRLSDATVCVSRAGAERHAAVHAVSPRRLRVIPNGVDTNRFRPDASQRARVRGLLGIQDEFAWLAAGRLMWKKDYPTMLRAMAQQRAGVLFIAGAGPLEAELRSLVCELGANVRFLGPREDIAELMNACDGLLLSSVVEGLPMVLLEAASSGLPCIATDAGGVREVVLDDGTGYVVPRGDYDAFARTMSRVAELPAEIRREMAHAAREHVLARFDLRVVAAQWEQIYLQLLETARCLDMEP